MSLDGPVRNETVILCTLSSEEHQFWNILKHSQAFPHAPSFINSQTAGLAHHHKRTRHLRGIPLLHIALVVLGDPNAVRPLRRQRSWDPNRSRCPTTKRWRRDGSWHVETCSAHGGGTDLSRPRPNSRSRVGSKGWVPGCWVCLEGSESLAQSQANKEMAKFSTKPCVSMLASSTT